MINNNEEQSGIKQRFLALVSDKDTTIMERNKRRIKYRKLLRFINSVHLFLIFKLKINNSTVNLLFKKLKNKIVR